MKAEKSVERAEALLLEAAREEGVFTYKSLIERVITAGSGGRPDHRVFRRAFASLVRKGVFVRESDREKGIVVYRLAGKR